MKNYIAPLIIAIGVVLAFWLVAGAYKYKYKAAETITVTGLAEKDFTSDQIVWKGNYSRKTMDLKTAYAQLKADEGKIKAYLKSKGVADTEMVFSAVTIDKDFRYLYDANGRNTGTEFTGYNLKQNVTVDSREIEKVEKISREVTELIESGIEFNSSSPSYYYSKLSELKVDLLANASADAKERASTIAKNSGSGLSKIKKATMGVFQITGKNSDEDYTYGGVFNTSSKNKTASITVRIEYAVK
ncbi:MAG TPA: SIMPL domain-containing protein [Chitinophagaceae bacterium]|nr:SIMPL domain-containing protein [Chitinophagaceae bacterium]MCB9054330.1 SIMPL domain-containing protein [Chitinophagales bacterium]HPG11679.1 SIMPL domain-containing protein [Chitinophagaceae bacterium]HRX93513.1 SIMPL domain-containing protein [Chitinophagaceae bacterium]